MQENQNTSEQAQPNKVVPAEVQESTKPATAEVKEEAPTLSTEALIPNTESETDHQPQTEAMEVQKHPHHVMHKKKWSEYLLEFFMLFLAVFLGFIAENIREHIVEHEREKKFTERLLSDLKQDTIVFQSDIRELRERQMNQAYFFKILSGTTKANDSSVTVSFFRLFRSWNPRFISATYNQMKMSGSLRFIRNDELTSKLQQYYDVSLPLIEREVTDVRKVFTDRIVPYMIAHFKLQDLQDSVTTKYSILNRSTESDQELINIMGVYGGGWDAVYNLHRSNLKQAEKLIEMIKKEYDFE